MNTVNERITALRKEMESKNIEAIILPSNDPHQSEYVADYWKIRAHFSGFTGSAGTLVITQNEAALWTDSRYFLQAEDELSTSFVQLHKQTIPHAPEHVPWLCDLLETQTNIGIDFSLFSMAQIDYLKEEAYAFDLGIINIPTLVDEVWTDRPKYSTSTIVDHPVNYAGENCLSKLKKLRKELKEQKINYNLISSLDEIAWVFNIRSKDVDFTPLATAYGLIGLNEVHLFIDENRLDAQLSNRLKEDGIETHAYTDIIPFLNSLGEEKSILTDASSLNYACKSAFSGTWKYASSKAQLLKSIKNKTEIEHAKKAMVRDGVALTKFFIWLEDYLKDNSINEYDLRRKLESFRQEQELYQYQSFDAIIGYKGNGAIIHYTAPENGSSEIQNEGVLLLDSGAQYQDATTDITRTVWLGGNPSEKLKEHYTAVLKGVISLDQLVFPENTSGIQIDGFARTHLWKQGLNFGHGTGHGIGSYGMVHEPAQGFATSTTTARGSAPHLENQFTTIEPGFYQEGEYGIRTENVVVSKVVKETEYGKFLGFEAITLCPIDTNLINFDLMTNEDVSWLNNYHEKVYAGISPYLDDTESTWLKEKCKGV